MFLENDVLEEISVPWSQRNRICKLHHGSREQCVKSKQGLWNWICGILQYFVLAYWLCELGQVTYLSLASIRLIVKWRQYFQISERLLVRENDRLGVMVRHTRSG